MKLSSKGRYQTTPSLTFSTLPFRASIVGADAPCIYYTTKPPFFNSILRGFSFFVIKMPGIPPGISYSVYGAADAKKQFLAALGRAPAVGANSQSVRVAFFPLIRGDRSGRGKGRAGLPVFCQVLY